ncbi:MAG: hypothetical protein ACLQPH_14660 [Acidimicrobiales bacterium]
MSRRALASAAGVAVVVAAAVAVVVVVVSDGSGSGAPATASAGTTTSQPAPLSSATATVTRSSLLVPMGDLDDPANTFWELLLRTGGSPWKLATPPGVADNGGLVVALPPSGPLTAGFLPSADLTFSPLAQTTDGGVTWSPGQLPTALAGAPDALAVSTTGSLLALVTGDGQTVLASSGDPSSWTPLTSTRTLGGRVGSCRVTALAAVSFEPSGAPLLGVRCGSGGVLGLLSPDAATPSGRPGWEGVGPVVGAPGGQTSVLRLEGTAAGMVGLGAVQSGTGSSLVAVWGAGAAGGWTQSSSLTVPSGWSVLATALGGSGGEGVTVLLGSGATRRVEQVDGPGSSWAELPAPPAGIGAVGVVGTETDAVRVSGSRLTVWALPAGSDGWRRKTVLTVPVPYGSSS